MKRPAPPSGRQTGRGFSLKEEGGTALKRADAKQHASHKPRSAQPPVPLETTDREVQLSLDRDELLGLMQDSLESLALGLAMLVVSSLLEDEVTRLCGPRHERQPHRTHTRYGHQRGTAVLAGQKIPIARPRVRRTDGGGEVPSLPTATCSCWAKSRWRSHEPCRIERLGFRARTGRGAFSRPPVAMPGRHAVE